MIFDRSGLAALSDLRAPGYAELFAELEGAQSDYVAHAPEFHDEPEEWLSDNLHNWSRAWEYAYVLHHVRSAVGRAANPPAVVDFGSGSTFFPFAVARLGARVICLDADPLVVEDFTRAMPLVSAGSGSIEIRQSGDVLPMESQSADCAYSVSVLEHIPNPVPVVAELARILRPGGRLVLTFDLDVEGDSGVSREHYEGLRADLEAHFDWIYGDRVIHPLDVLTSKNSPWPRPGERKAAGVLWRDGSGRVRPLIGGPNPGVLTVYGCALRRRE